MQEKIKLSSGSYGLGDILLLTSVAKYLNEKIIIQLPTSKERFSILFKNLCEVEITDNLNENIYDVGLGHYATRKLRYFFNDAADHLDNRPLTLYFDLESEQWVLDFLKNIKNPIIFTPHCSLLGSSERNIPKKTIENILSNLFKQGYTPIICQNSKNMYTSIYENQLIDLDLNKYICLLRKVGNYIGCNTGDMHLAIAVGALTTVFEPKEAKIFKRQEWSYNHPSIKYFIW
jgi:hypothetical protein